MSQIISIEFKHILNTIAGILFRCFVFSIILLIVWFVWFLIAGGIGHQIHSNWFDLTKHEFDLMNYYGMALIKLFSTMLFLIPFIAIKLMLHKEDKST